jgi:hypothetical protein
MAPAEAIGVDQEALSIDRTLVELARRVAAVGEPETRRPAERQGNLKSMSKRMR